MNNDKYYFLRKVTKDDDRALYRHNWYDRFYRSSYPIPEYKSFKLYKVKELSTILSQREALHYYCNEWFDVYDQDENIVHIEEK